MLRIYPNLGQEREIDQEETLAVVEEIAPEVQPSLAVVTPDIPTEEDSVIAQTSQAS